MPVCEWIGQAVAEFWFGGRAALLLELRRSALLYAENHFTPLSRRSKRECVLSHLAARFFKPRFRIYAWSGVVDGEIGSACASWAGAPELGIRMLWVRRCWRYD